MIEYYKSRLPDTGGETASEEPGQGGGGGVSLFWVGFLGFGWLGFFACF